MKMAAIDYQVRIKKACDLLGEDAMLVLAQPEAMRNSDVGFSYRQESFFYYLLGFEEPGSALVLLGAKTKSKRRAVLFLRERDPVMELWHGRRLGVEAAVQTLAVDEAFSVSKLWERVPELIKEADKLFYRFGLDASADQNVVNSLLAEKKIRGRASRAVLKPVYDSFLIAGEMRIRKSPPEMERMRHAAAITAKAFAKVFATVRPGMNERQVQALLLQEFFGNGAEMEAYGTIVAGGANACCLHYTENKAPLKDGELLLVDAGSQFDYYASDVTRTFPIGKAFTGEQKALYEIVLDAQLKCIAATKVGSNLVKIHDIALRRLSEGLIELGLLDASLDEVLEKHLYRDYYPHGTSHWLGMDVHDVGDYSLDGKPMPLQEGMCLTIEPGLYIQPDNKKAPKKMRGLGIRIEDDILVTKKGPEILTKDIPKSVKDMENRF